LSYHDYGISVLVLELVAMLMISHGYAICVVVVSFEPVSNCPRSKLRDRGAGNFKQGEIAATCDAFESSKIPHQSLSQRGVVLYYLCFFLPPPISSLPSFASLPCFVQGIPVARDIRRLAFVIPKNRLHENPPRFMTQPPFVLASFEKSDTVQHLQVQ
jgi:hypothetical protein